MSGGTAQDNIKGNMGGLGKRRQRRSWIQNGVRSRFSSGAGRSEGVGNGKTSYYKGYVMVREVVCSVRPVRDKFAGGFSIDACQIKDDHLDGLRVGYNLSGSGCMEIQIHVEQYAGPKHKRRERIRIDEQVAARLQEQFFARKKL